MYRGCSRAAAEATSSSSAAAAAGFVVVLLVRIGIGIEIISVIGHLNSKRTSLG